MGGGYLTKVAETTGLRYFPNLRTFTDKKGGAVGAKNGYLVAIARAGGESANLVATPLRLVEFHGLANRLAPSIQEKTADQTLPTISETTIKTQRAAICLVVRFQRSSRLEELQRELNQSGESLPTHEFQLGSDFLCVAFPYSLSPPKPEEVGLATEKLLTLIQKYAEPFNGRCELCEIATTEIHIFEGVPVYYCLGCQERMKSNSQKAAERFEGLPLRLRRGFVFGGFAALAGGLLREVVTSLFRDYYNWCAFGVGILVPWAVSYGMVIEDDPGSALNLWTRLLLAPARSKTGVSGKVMSLGLTASAIWLENFCSLTLSQLTASQSPGAAREVYWLSNVLAATLLSIPYLPAALFGTALVLWMMRRPKFQSKVERLDAYLP